MSESLSDCPATHPRYEDGGGKAGQVQAGQVPAAPLPSPAQPPAVSGAGPCRSDLPHSPGSVIAAFVHTSPPLCLSANLEDRGAWKGAMGGHTGIT